MSKIPREPRTAPRARYAAPLLAAALALTGCTAGSDQASGDRTAATAWPGPGATPATPSPAPRDAAPRDAAPRDAVPEPGTSPPGTSQPGTSQHESAGPGAPVPHGRSGGQSGGEGSEVAPSEPGSAGDRLGDVRVPSAGRLLPTQDTGNAAGLVRGFPADVVLVPADATVSSSSVTGTDDRYQVALDAVVEGACTDVLLDYRAWFTTGGFAETGTTSRPGRTTVDLERNDGTVQVDATRDTAGCAVTVFAVLSVR